VLKTNRHFLGEVFAKRTKAALGCGPSDNA